MAIDKSIDTKKMPQVEIDEDVEVVMPQEFQEGGDVDIQITDDGGAEVDFDPEAAAMEGGQFHDANLAEFMDDGALTALASELQESYDEYKSSRSDWEDGFIKGLDLLGFKYENRSERT